MRQLTQKNFFFRSVIFLTLIFFSSNILLANYHVFKPELIDSLKKMDKFIMHKVQVLKGKVKVQGKKYKQTRYVLLLGEMHVKSFKASKQGNDILRQIALMEI